MQGVHVMKRPVFVVGCPRSGTTLLYSMLVAAGGFAFYRKETYLFVVAHRFPHLATDRARGRFLNEFLAGYLGHVPGLDIQPIVHRSIRGCETPADFLPRLMEGVAQAQHMDRWVEATPDARALPARDQARCSGRARRARHQGWTRLCPVA